MSNFNNVIEATDEFGGILRKLNFPFGDGSGLSLRLHGPAYRLIQPHRSDYPEKGRLRSPSDEGMSRLSRSRVSTIARFDHVDSSAARCGG